VLEPLPIDDVLPEIVARLADAPNLVIEAPPGAGKTTRVPRALLDAWRDRDPSGAPDREIVVLEPRRLATRMAARRVAEELGEAVGGTIGYRVRFEDVGSARTRVRFVTEGVLTRMLVDDPRLARVGCVVLDEFHERHLHADVALALLRRAQETARPDLRIVAMSATLDAGPVAAFLGAAQVRSLGRRFDVAIEHLPQADDRPLASQVSSAVRRLFTEQVGGDVLVFLPGAGEIRQALESCERIAPTFGFDAVPLHGDLSLAEQDRAVRRGPRPKVILSTNVAESSVTIEGVVAVVDSGLARVASVSPWSGFARLEVKRVSRASATQRAGRAGRLRPGRCLRLFTRGDFDTRPEHDAPEIRRLDLAQTVLELAALGLAPKDLGWLDAPAEDAVLAAERLLVRPGLLGDDGALTEVGRRARRHAVHPRAARILVEAERQGVAEDAAVLVAILTEGDPRLSTRAQFGARRGAGGHGATERSDLIALLDLFREAEERGLSPGALRSLELDPGTVHAIERARKQLSRSSDRSGTREKGSHAPRAEAATSTSPEAIEERLLRAVLTGYPDHVARRVRPGGRALALAGGGSAELAEHSVVRDAQWMVAAGADERRGVLVRLASAIEPDWLLDLPSAPITEREEVRWNGEAERVESSSALLYDGLVLTESRATASPEAVARALAAAALAAGPRAFDPDDALSHWLSRARFAAENGAGFAAPTEDDVREALAAACEGRSTFAELRETPLPSLLEARLGAGARARIDDIAPERVTLASGRSARISYDAGKPPWIEAHLQDFFGTLRTPRVARGAVPLVVHLLGPNKRAVQVTTDLEGFWDRHYPALRRELMRKYPRHFWPEDPRVAEARLRVGRK
jgi:ATP-dependent helicase HrpB